MIRTPVLVIFGLGVIGMVMFFLLRHVEEPHKYSLTQIELADTREKQVRGLGGRSEIPDDYGMLFVFAEPVIQRFWMKDMQVPIDIIWVADDGKIVGILPGVATSTYPTIFSSPAPVRYVLETQAGLSARRGWGAGTTLTLPIK